MGEATKLQQRVVAPIAAGRNVLIQTGPGNVKLNAIAVAALQFAQADSPATSQVLVRHFACLGACLDACA
jgi:hypothetical protein